MSLETILSRIAEGETVSAIELLPYLSFERRERRESVNTLLAEAYLKSGSEKHLEYAKVFIDRAWLLSRFSPQLLPLYIQIYSALDNISGIREAYKRVGMMMAAKGKLGDAIRYFDLWQYAYAEFLNIDKYQYDFDILDCIDRLARPYRFPPRRRRLRNKKIRIAYLLKGIKELGSVLIKLNLLFAQYHDRSRVEPLFFVPESEDEVIGSVEGGDTLRLLESYGCKLIMGPNAHATDERLLAVGRRIYKARADILVTSAALATFDHYFITSLRPAPVVIGLVQGPPPQFAPLALDWGIAWSKHPLIDCPVSCSQLFLEQHLPNRAGIVPSKKSELDLPDRSCVIASAGRYTKFQDPEFWKAIIAVLKDRPETYYLAMGVEESQIPFISSMLSRAIRSQIRFVGWRGNDYLSTLSLADIYIDTFPSGGGCLVDAMALGIAVVAFRNDYMKVYDQTDWSPAEELIEIRELVVPPGDFAEMKRVVSHLIDDQEDRRDLAQRCQAHTVETMGDPARGVRRAEEIYDRILQNLGSREVEIEGVTRRSLVAGTARQLKRALHLGERVIDRIAERKN